MWFLRFIINKEEKNYYQIFICTHKTNNIISCLNKYGAQKYFIVGVQKTVLCCVLYLFRDVKTGVENIDYKKIIFVNV